MDNQEYLKLRDKWYRKLEREGFHDIENFRNSGEAGNLLDGLTAGQMARREKKHGVGLGPEDHSPPGTLIGEHAEYYRRAEQWTNTLECEGWPLKYLKVWKQHADGVAKKKAATVSGLSKSHGQEWIEFQEQRMLKLNSKGYPRRGPEDIPLPALVRCINGRYRVVTPDRRVTRRNSTGEKLDGGGWSKAHGTDKAADLARRINLGRLR